MLLCITDDTLVTDTSRFHFMWEFLGLPWQDIELLPKGSKPRANL
jgi:glutathione S-transferase kappa 1